MTGTNCDFFTHNQSQSYLNHLVYFGILQQDRQCMYDVTLRRIHETTITVEKQYYIFLCVCVCVCECVWAPLACP
jgi:hypothetical protein